MTTESSPTDSRGLIRLEVQVEGLAKEVHRLNNIIMGANSPSDARFQQHEKLVNTRLESIEDNQNSIKVLVEKLSDRMETKSKFPWAQVIGFVGLLMTLGGGIGGMIMSGIRSDLSRVERDVTAVQSQVVPRIEHQGRWTAYDDSLNKLQSRIDILESKRNR